MHSGQLLLHPLHQQKLSRRHETDTVGLVCLVVSGTRISGFFDWCAVSHQLKHVLLSKGVSWQARQELDTGSVIGSFRHVLFHQAKHVLYSPGDKCQQMNRNKVPLVLRTYKGKRYAILRSCCISPTDHGVRCGEAQQEQHVAVIYLCLAPLTPCLVTVCCFIGHWEQLALYGSLQPCL